jgi:Flp pilus assembly protein protease CpaA
MLLSCAILMWISTKDLRDHIITNRSLVVLSASLLISFKGFINLTLGVATFISLILIATLVDIGGGDVKLITALALFVDIQHPLLHLITMITALAATHILIIWIIKRKLSTRLALAPSICIPTIYSILLN